MKQLFFTTRLAAELAAGAEAEVVTPRAVLSSSPRIMEVDGELTEVTYIERSASPGILVRLNGETAFYATQSTRAAYDLLAGAEKIAKDASQSTLT